MSTKLRILILEDRATDAELMLREEKLMGSDLNIEFGEMIAK